MWKALAVVALMVAGCSRPEFVNIGKDATGAEIGVLKTDIDKYAAEHRISFQEACRRMAAEQAAP